MGISLPQTSERDFRLALDYWLSAPDAHLEGAFEGLLRLDRWAERFEERLSGPSPVTHGLTSGRPFLRSQIGMSTVEPDSQRRPSLLSSRDTLPDLFQGSGEYLSSLLHPLPQHGDRWEDVDKGRFQEELPRIGAGLLSYRRREPLFREVLPPLTAPISLSLPLLSQDWQTSDTRLEGDVVSGVSGDFLREPEPPGGGLRHTASFTLLEGVETTRLAGKEGYRDKSGPDRTRPTFSFGGSQPLVPRQLEIPSFERWSMRRLKGPDFLLLSLPSSPTADRTVAPRLSRPTRVLRDLREPVDTQGFSDTPGPFGIPRRPGVPRISGVQGAYGVTFLRPSTGDVDLGFLRIEVLSRHIDPLLRGLRTLPEGLGAGVLARDSRTERVGLESSPGPEVTLPGTEPLEVSVSKRDLFQARGLGEGSGLSLLMGGGPMLRGIEPDLSGPPDEEDDRQGDFRAKTLRRFGPVGAPDFLVAQGILSILRSEVPGNETEPLLGKTWVEPLSQRGSVEAPWVFRAPRTVGTETRPYGEGTGLTSMSDLLLGVPELPYRVLEPSLPAGNLTLPLLYGHREGPVQPGPLEDVSDGVTPTLLSWPEGLRFFPVETLPTSVVPVETPRPFLTPDRLPGGPLVGRESDRDVTELGIGLAGTLLVLRGVGLFEAEEEAPGLVSGHLLEAEGLPGSWTREISIPHFEGLSKLTPDLVVFPESVSWLDVSREPLPELETHVYPLSPGIEGERPMLLVSPTREERIGGDRGEPGSTPRGREGQHSYETSLLTGRPGTDRWSPSLLLLPLLSTPIGRGQAEPMLPQGDLADRSVQQFDLARLTGRVPVSERWTDGRMSPFLDVSLDMSEPEGLSFEGVESSRPVPESWPLALMAYTSLLLGLEAGPSELAMSSSLVPGLETGSLPLLTAPLAPLQSTTRFSLTVEEGQDALFLAPDLEKSEALLTRLLSGLFFRPEEVTAPQTEGDIRQGSSTGLVPQWRRVEDIGGLEAARPFVMPGLLRLEAVSEIQGTGGFDARAYVSDISRLDAVAPVTPLSVPVSSVGGLEVFLSRLVPMGLTMQRVEEALGSRLSADFGEAVGEEAVGKGKMSRGPRSSVSEGRGFLDEAGQWTDDELRTGTGRKRRQARRRGRGLLLPPRRTPRDEQTEFTSRDRRAEFLWEGGRTGTAPGGSPTKSPLRDRWRERSLEGMRRGPSGAGTEGTRGEREESRRRSGQTERQGAPDLARIRRVLDRLWRLGRRKAAPQLEGGKPVKGTLRQGDPDRVGKDGEARPWKRISGVEGERKHEAIGLLVEEFQHRRTRDRRWGLGPVYVPRANVGEPEDELLETLRQRMRKESAWELERV